MSMARLTTLFWAIAAIALGLSLIGCRTIETAPGDERVLAIAHRGGKAPGYAENTLPALRRAIDLGVDVIELDLRVTLDKHTVIIHDSTLDRTTNGKGRVREHTLEMIRHLDAGYGERVPTFEEVLDLVQGQPVMLLLDIKKGRRLDRPAVVAAIEARDLVGQVIIGARTIEDVQRFRPLNRNIPILAFVESTRDIDDFISHGVDIVRLWSSWIGPDASPVRHVLKRGPSVWVTALGADRAKVKWLAQFGVEGVVLDRPELIVGARAVPLATIQRSVLTNVRSISINSKPHDL